MERRGHPLWQDLIWVAFSLRQGEIACRRIGRYDDPEELPIGQFLELCGDVRAYEADEYLRDLSSRSNLAAMTAGDEASFKELAMVLKDLQRIRVRPLR